VKTLISVSEAQIAVAALAEITVVQGEPAQFELALPEGYEVTGVTGASLDSSDTRQGTLILKVRAGTERAHQFLISMEKAIGATTKIDVPMPTLKGAQRETGEVLIEAEGTMELAAKEAGGLARMDLRESSPYLRTLARSSLQAAFRYRRQPSETPTVGLEWVRYPDATLLAAVAQDATVTTLVTSEGKSLTEVKLTVRNQAQPFLKLGLPAGATVLSSEVAGDKVKPVQAPDGIRVPLLKPGFHPAGEYAVSFVFQHAGAPFAKKGGAELALPGMDIPIGLLNWEVFLPAQCKVENFGGNALPADRVPRAVDEVVDEEVPGEAAPASYNAPPPPPMAEAPVNLGHLRPGQLGGYVKDPTGAGVPGASVTVKNLSIGVEKIAETDSVGRWVVDDVPAGRMTIRAIAPGFNATTDTISYSPIRPSVYNLVLKIGSVTESIEVVTGAVAEPYKREQKKEDLAAQLAPSTNVLNLQQRVAGALPIRVDVPHEGASYRFVRPLVLNEETKLTFTYRKK